MNVDADVIIVGGGPAGLATSLFLAAADASAAARVVVLERDEYPRDKPCAGGIGGRADRALSRIGVTVDVPSAFARGVAVTLRAGRVERREPRGRTVGRVVRRAEFDVRLAAIAADRGIRIEQGTKLLAVEAGEQHVTLETNRGSLRARAVVGADGVGSVVRRALAPRASRFRAQVVEVDTPWCEGDVARDVLHFDASDPRLDGYAWDFPVPADPSLVCRGVYALKLPGREGPDPSALLDARLRALGIEPSAVRVKRYAERGFSARGPLARPRLMLVGEAAGIDPVSGEGIAQAIAYGEVAGPYLARAIRLRSYAFDDWPLRLRRSLVGLDLLGRERLANLFFSDRRAFYERALGRVPATLDVGLQYFAGLPLDAGTTAKVVALGLALELGDLPGRLVDQARRAVALAG